MLCCFRFRYRVFRRRFTVNFRMNTSATMIVISAMRSEEANRKREGIVTGIIEYKAWQKRKATEFEAVDEAAKKVIKQKAVVARNARLGEYDRQNADCTGPALVGSDTGMYPFYHTRP